jgi:hypothetical protein
MGALVRMKPKPHEDMKVGKFKTKVAKSRRRDELKQEIKVKKLVESNAIARAIKRPEE